MCTGGNGASASASWSAWDPAKTPAAATGGLPGGIQSYTGAASRLAVGGIVMAGVVGVGALLL